MSLVSPIVYICSDLHAACDFSWLLMHYPIPKPTRIKLLLYYYGIALLPGIEPRIIRGAVNMFSQLLTNKKGSPRMVETWDLELEWRPLWRSLQKDLWPMRRLQDSSYVCRRIQFESRLIFLPIPVAEIWLICCYFLLRSLNGTSQLKKLRRCYLPFSLYSRKT